MPAILALTAAVIAIAPASARATECPAQTVQSVEIIEFTDELGCTEGPIWRARRSATTGSWRRTGSTAGGDKAAPERSPATARRSTPASARTRPTQAEATFLARPPLAVCDGDRSDGDDLRARYLECSVARRVYRRSLTIAARHLGKPPIRFGYAGHRWTCRAYNPHHRNGNPAWYECECRARNDALVHYRWFPGD